MQRNRLTWSEWCVEFTWISCRNSKKLHCWSSWQRQHCLPDWAALYSVWRGRGYSYDVGQWTLCIFVEDIQGGPKKWTANALRISSSNIGRFLPREAYRSAVSPNQVVRPSVRLSVTLRYRGHIGWNSWKIISRLISLTFPLSAVQTADPNITDLIQREHPQIFAGIGVE